MAECDAVRVVETLIYELAWRLDQGRSLETAELFTEACQYGIEGAVVDRAGLLQQMAARSSAPFVTRHMLSNTRIVQATGQDVEATATVLVYKLEPAKDGPPMTTILAGDWLIRAELRNETWRLAALVVRPASLTAAR